MVGQAADRRGVGAPVVVDDDDQPAVLPVGDVVQRLPGHAAREGTVADDGHDVPVAAALQLVGLGDAVGPAQRRRRVRVLHDVVRPTRCGSGSPDRPSRARSFEKSVRPVRSLCT